MLIKNLTAIDFDERVLSPDLGLRRRAYSLSSKICRMLRNSVWLSIDSIESLISIQTNSLCRFILSVAARRIPRSETEEMIRKLESPKQSTGRPDFMEKEIAAVWARSVTRGSHPFPVFMNASAVLGRDFLSKAWSDLKVQAEESLVPTKIAFRGQRSAKDQKELEALFEDLASSKGIRRVYKELGLEAFVRSLAVCGESTRRKVLSGFGTVFGTALADMVSRSSREASDTGINAAVVTSIAKLIELKKTSDLFSGSAGSEKTDEVFVEKLSFIIKNLDNAVLSRVLQEIDGRVFHASLWGMDEGAREKVFSVLSPKIVEKLRMELKESARAAVSEIKENGEILAESVLDLCEKGAYSLDAGTIRRIKELFSLPGSTKSSGFAFTHPIAGEPISDEEAGDLEELLEDEGME